MTTRSFVRDEIQPTQAEFQQIAEADRLTDEPCRSRIPRLLDVAEAAQELGLPKASVYRYIAQKLIKVTRFHRRIKISEDDLIEFINSGGAGLPE